MTRFEDELRRGLAAAAQQAPPFTGSPEPTVSTPTVSTPVEPPRRPRHRSPRFLVAAAAVVAVGAGASVALAQRGDDVITAVAGGLTEGGDDVAGSSASCAALLSFEGRTYGPTGELQRIPRPGPEAGAGSLLGCDDGAGLVPDQPVTVSRFADVPPEVAVVENGTVWVSEGSAPPAALSELRTPLPCTDEVSSVTGRVREVDAEATADYELVAPYTAMVLAESAPGTALQPYAAVLLPVAVSPTTTGGTDPALLRAALGEDAAVTVTLTCSGTAWSATSMALTP